MPNRGERGLSSISQHSEAPKGRQDVAWGASPRYRSQPGIQPRRGERSPGAAALARVDGRRPRSVGCAAPLGLRIGLGARFLGLAPQATCRRPFGTLSGCGASGSGPKKRGHALTAGAPASLRALAPGFPEDTRLRLAAKKIQSPEARKNASAPCGRIRADKWPGEVVSCQLSVRKEEDGGRGLSPIACRFDLQSAAAQVLNQISRFSH